MKDFYKVICLFELEMRNHIYLENKTFNILVISLNKLFRIYKKNEKIIKSAGYFDELNGIEVIYSAVNYSKIISNANELISNYIYFYKRVIKIKQELEKINKKIA